MRFSERLRADRSEAILDAASRVAGEKGWSGLTIDAVAREAGVAKGTIYLHYAGKEALLIALSKRAAAHLTAVIREEAARVAHPIGQLHAAYQRLVAEPEPNGPLLTLLQSCACLPRAARQAGSGIVGSLLDLLTELIHDGQTRGAFPLEVDAAAVAASFVALATIPTCVTGDRFQGVAIESLWSIYERGLGGPALAERPTDRDDPVLRD